MEFFLGILSGLFVGLVIGLIGHRLAVQLADRERAIASATELWDRCSEVANARVKYILAYHRDRPNRQQLNDEHKDLKRRFRWADPELILMGVPEWEAYHDAEVDALRTPRSTAEKVKRLETMGYALLEAIGERRTAAQLVSGGK